MIIDKHIKEITDLVISLHPILSKKDIQIQETRKEFKGDWTIVIFPMLKLLKRDINDIASSLGKNVVQKLDYVSNYNIVKGFLNLEFTDSFWFNMLEKSHSKNFHINQSKQKHIVVESCSPNTNKPLHLGHLRNILLGHAISNILIADGYKVSKVQIINDRGIHICKSMLAWAKFGNGENPMESGIKGDHLVGKYYVIFEQAYQEEQKVLINDGLSVEEAKLNSKLLIEVKSMLQKWESGDAEIIALWKKMNNWVYDGFDLTYKKIGVSFDKIYYESDTYLVGKEHILKGLNNHTFYQKPDDSVWVNLDNYKLEDKLLLRSDGTAVYMTQDVGTAIVRHDELSFDQMIYIVGSEQNHHFKVLFSILNKMGCPWSSNLDHLSYGMVNLPDGKMKSREGNVVDIDDLLQEMYQRSKSIILKSDKSDFESVDELALLIGDAALKYFILKPDPKKEILFNPDESIDFNGHTGPFIQYTYARINSILTKAQSFHEVYSVNRPLLLEEKSLIKLIVSYPIVLSHSASNLNPALIANFLYTLSKEYNHFYQKIPILNMEEKNDINFRVTISKKVSVLIHAGMNLLGMKVPVKM